MKSILIVEDEQTISRVLAVYLKHEGYEILQGYDGKQGLHLFTQHQPDLVLLDVMLPEMDGWDVLKEIRNISSCPVIMLTALGDIDYRLKGLNQGADDYISKPFVGEEVVARVNAVLRRSPQVLETENMKQFGSLKINMDSHVVTVHGEKVVLTPKDLSLLIFLADRPNRTFTRDVLLENVWGMDYDGSDRAVDLSIKRIRHSHQSQHPGQRLEVRDCEAVHTCLCFLVYLEK